MDKEKVIKKIKQGAPAASAIVVAACIGVSLSGYHAPVYELRRRQKRRRQQMTMRQRRKVRPKGLLIWQMESIKEPELVMPER